MRDPILSLSSHRPSWLRRRLGVLVAGGRGGILLLAAIILVSLAWDFAQLGGIRSSDEAISAIARVYDKDRQPLILVPVRQPPAR